MHDFMLRCFRYLLISVLLYNGVTVAQNPIQVQVYNESPAELRQWIMHVLHGGGGYFDTASIKFIGNYQAFGKFTNGQDIGIDSGLVLSTGQAIRVGSPNNNGYDSQDLGAPGDSSLLQMYVNLYETFGIDSLPIDTTGDAAVIEFNYRPYGDKITLQYIFASEEYLYTPNPSKDVDLTGFAGPSDQMFDLFGIGIDFIGRPFVDLAKLPLPEGGDFVSLHSVNDHTNVMFYQSNPPDVGPMLGTEFDGFTKPSQQLIIVKQVIPCVYYHIKIAIEDFWYNAQDPANSGFMVNSALFLGGGSFTGGKNVPPWKTDWRFTNSSFPDGQLIEGGCKDLLVTFHLQFAAGIDYYIPFAIRSSIYRSNLLITNESDSSIITGDSVFFNPLDTVRTIRIEAVNITNDIPNVKFTFPQDPCEKPHPPFGQASYSGEIPLLLRNNTPIAFTVIPKEYSAYCKDTIELTLTDVTQGGVSPLNYLWENNLPPADTFNYQVQNNPDFVNVRVNDGCGNVSDEQVKINNKPIQLQQIPPVSFCQPGQSINLEAIVNMPNSNDYSFTVDWYKLYQGNESFMGSGNPFLIFYDNAIGEDTWYAIYRITDVCGGTVEDTVKIDQTGKLDLGNDRNICKGDTLSLQTYTPAISYRWYVLGNNTPFATTNEVNVQPDITTIYILKIVDMCNLAQEDTIVVNVDFFKPQISIDPITAEICMGGSVTLSANEAQNYYWQPGGETSQSIIVSPGSSGSYIYFLTASSVYCFDKRDTVEFKVFPQPSATFQLNPSQNACTGEDIQFTYDSIASGKNFLWKFGDGDSSTLNSPTHAYINSGVYTVNLNVEQYICKSDSSLSVNIDPLPLPDFSVEPNEGCLPLEVNFYDASTNLFPGAIYAWNFGNGNTSTDKNPITNYNNAGNYTISLKVTNTERCFAQTTKPKVIHAFPKPIANFKAQPWISTLDAPDIKFIDLSKSDSILVNYQWNFGDGSSSTESNPMHTYTNAGDYRITLAVESINDCWDTTFAKVAITENVKLFFPNAFTPNNDGINDKFVIKGTPMSDFNIYIFNRWGSQIWSSHSFENQWDGTDLNGKPVPPGNYIYVVKGIDYLGRPFSYKGNVNVIR